MAAELQLSLYDSSDTVTVWAHDARPDVLQIRTNRGATVALDFAAVIALEKFLRDNRPPNPDRPAARGG